MLYLIIDILIYNFTPYLSYFFLVNLNSKDYIYNLLLAIILDYITGLYFYNIIFVTFIYYLKKYVLKFNYHNLLIYYLVNIIIILLYYLCGCTIFSYILIKNIINVLIINSIFIVICYKKDVLNIKYGR